MKNLVRQLKQTRRAKKKRNFDAIMTRHKLMFRTQYLENQTLHSTEQGVGNALTQELTVSLTTFGRRIHDVYLPIESIMQQSLRPDRIVLNLSGEDFSEQSLPETLKRQQKRGLEILFVEKDLGPYTKYHYALQKYPQSLLITVDDDFLYPIDTVDRLYKSYLERPDCIHCHRGHVITLDDNGSIRSYRQWDWSNKHTEPSLRVFPTGVGGVLYFPGCFDPEISNQAAFMELAPCADDVWLKAMSLKKGTPCRIVKDSRDFMTNFLTIEGSQEISLKRRNKHGSFGNDEKIRAVFSHYDLMKKLKEST
jgi:hypothetical protein